MCCDQLKIRSVVEQVKKHPRDYFSFGRLRIELLRDGKPTNSQIPNKRKFFAAMGEIIHAQNKIFGDMLEKQKSEVASRMEAMQKAQMAA